MSVIGSNILAGASGQGGGYNLTRSLRFRSSASAYLNRTPASAGNRRTFTISTWIKRGTLGSLQRFNTAGNLGLAKQDCLQFNSNDTFQMNTFNGSVGYTLGATSQVFRDPAAWYHIVVAVDTTQATDTNRWKLYVNGSQVTSLTNYEYPAQNYDFSFNNTIAQMIGRDAYSGSQYFDGYMTETYMIDGQALTPSSFGEFSATTGVWQPKKYAGTYGTNGFYLPFTNNSTTTTLGNDFSGNGNNWTTNNISLTAGSTYDSMTDVPTLTSATASNFAVVNPLKTFTGGLPTISSANLNLSASDDVTRQAIATMGFNSGKYYWETTVLALVSNFDIFVGIIPESVALGSATSSVGTYRAMGQIRNLANTVQTSGDTYTTNDVVGIAVDCDAGTVQFYKNGTAQGSTPSFTFTANTFVFPSFILDNQTGTRTIAVNFGQRPFAYTPPTGFAALNTFNLPTPTIGATASTQANKYMDISLYTGTGSTQTITNSGGFQPDFLWAKARSGAFVHVLTNAVTGSTNALQSNSTNGEFTVDTTYTSNGFIVNSDVNNSGNTYVGWQWKANGTGVTNTAGSITSTVSANTSSGFSIVTYTGTGSAATVGHGLGVAPSMIITHARNDASQWGVYHKYVDASAPQNYTLLLNSTAAREDNNIYWNDTAPTSSVFSVLYAGATNATSTTYVAYCFSEVAGYSRFGSYTGNGSSDGPFVFCGFRPKFILWKRTDRSGDDWNIYDTSRNTYNVVNLSLSPNNSNAEYSGDTLDIVSNGFKLRTTSGSNNGNGGTYIYAAFAEFPTKFSLAR